MIRTLVIAAALCGPAQAQQAQCGPRDVVIKALAAKWAETQRGIGIAGGGLVMEVWASAGGTWTITVTTPEGATCLVASGTGFEVIAAPMPGVPG